MSYALLGRCLDVPKISVFGVDMCLVQKPVFGRSFFLRRIPSTAKNPTLPQRKARAWLATTAHGLIDTWGATAEMPNIAKAIQARAPGVGAHGGKSKRDYVIAKRVSAERISALQRAAGS